MRIHILGCNGGIGVVNSLGGARAARAELHGDAQEDAHTYPNKYPDYLFTTSFLIDHDVLIDAGTGVSSLSIEQMRQIDHIFLTHAHLDHICSIPFLIDSVHTLRTTPLIIHALPETIEVLKKHIFNWSVWPDFCSIPSPEQPCMRFEPLKIGATFMLNERTFTVLPANHIVPAVGYAITTAAGSFAFSGDTTVNDAFWPIVNQLPDLKILIIETAFCNRERDLAFVSKHLCPSLLAEELQKFTSPAQVYITHLKPPDIELTMQEIKENVQRLNVQMLENGAVFEI